MAHIAKKHRKEAKRFMKRIRLAFDYKMSISKAARVLAKVEKIMETIKII